MKDETKTEREGIGLSNTFEDSEPRKFAIESADPFLRGVLSIGAGALAGLIGAYLTFTATEPDYGAIALLAALVAFLIAFGVISSISFALLMRGVVNDFLGGSQ